jgi:hypothetical protein
MIKMYQATEKKANLMFRICDKPFPTREECEREAIRLFGKGNYTIEAIMRAASDPR